MLCNIAFSGVAERLYLLLLLFALVCLLGHSHAGIILQGSEESHNNCALLFFGLGRKLKDVAFPYLRQNVIDMNPSCDIFIHTFNVTRAAGRRQGEDGSGIIDVNEVFLIAKKQRITIETEEQFLNRRDLNHYRSFFPKPSHWEYPTSMDNMVRQWHSIEEVWAKMEAFEENRRLRYLLVGLFRLDVIFPHPVVVSDQDGPATIPQMMYRPTASPKSWGGYNDRLFYGKREYAKLWATKRFPSVELYLLWQKSDNYIEGKSGVHSEDFLRWLVVFHYAVPLSMASICVKRIRSSGITMNNDCDLLRDKATHRYHSLLRPEGKNPNLVAMHPEIREVAAHEICAVVRTHPGQANLLPITLLSLTQQSYRKPDISMSLFVVNTDPANYKEADFMHVAAADANKRAKYNAVSVLDQSFHKKQPLSAAYGYDVTDNVLEYLLQDEANCTHFLFTNGDNFYLPSLVDWVKPALLHGKQLIGWDFLTHHKRQYNVIRMKFLRKFIDLGSVLVDKHAIIGTRVRFLPNGMETPDIFARDYFFFKKIYDHVTEENISIIHQVLFSHQ